MEQLKKILARNGIGTPYTVKKWEKNNAILLNEQNISLSSTVKPNDIITINGVHYPVSESKDAKRLRLHVPTYKADNIIKGKIRAHCCYHKCLTMYVRRCFNKIVRITHPFTASYRHFYHRIDDFYRDCHDYTLSTISGHVINLDQFEDIRITRFIRDPRDILISGYFYHKRSAEDWCDHINPEEDDWGIVNGAIPKLLPKNMSFAQFLNTRSLEEGLLAEIDFRKHHFESMLNFDDNDERVRTYRYEDIIGNESETFNDIYDFFEIPFLAKKAGLYYVRKYSASVIKNKSTHIRNPNSGQWKKYFTPKVETKFNEKYSDLLIKLGYQI